MRKKKILLTGASGTIGKEIFRELLSKSEQYELTLFLRPSRKNKKLFKPWMKSTKIIWGTILNYDDLKKAVFNKDVIIHAAGVLPDIAMFQPDIAKLTNINGTNNVLTAIMDQKFFPKIIFTSSEAVYGKHVEDPIIKLSDPVDLDTNDTYTYTKIEAEKLIINSGMQYCIFRIPYVVAVEMLRFRKIMFHIPLDTWLEIIHVKDVATGIVNAIESDKVWGKIFNIGGGKECQIKYGENLSDYYEIMGFGREFLPETAFAKKGISGGIYDLQETQDLQNLLNFQHHTLQDFYYEVREWIGIKKYLYHLIKPIARWYILRKSEPYHTYKESRK
ncbi:MAG: NAD-dependent epimerase/dehydratase family protein [Promethearchaeota archaeon]